MLFCSSATNERTNERTVARSHTLRRRRKVYETRAGFPWRICSRWCIYLTCVCAFSLNDRNAMMAKVMRTCVCNSNELSISRNMIFYRCPAHASMKKKRHFSRYRQDNENDRSILGKTASDSSFSLRRRAKKRKGKRRKRNRISENHVPFSFGESFFPLFSVEIFLSIECSRLFLPLLVFFYFIWTFFGDVSSSLNDFIIRFVYWKSRRSIIEFRFLIDSGQCSRY